MQEEMIQTKFAPSREASPAPRADVLAYPLDEELVLCDERSGEVFTLNRTGARVWTLCDGKSTIEQIARAIAEEFHLEEAPVYADVEAHIADLLDAELVTLP